MCRLPTVLTQYAGIEHSAATSESCCSLTIRQNSKIIRFYNRGFLFLILLNKQASSHILRTLGLQHNAKFTLSQILFLLLNTQLTFFFIISKLTFQYLLVQTNRYSQVSNKSWKISLHAKFKKYNTHETNYCWNTKKNTINKSYHIICIINILSSFISATVSSVIDGWLSHLL
jgi:hypothetical protein